MGWRVVVGSLFTGLPRGVGEPFMMEPAAKAAGTTRAGELNVTLLQY